jgi:hypothetical protein
VCAVLVAALAACSSEPAPAPTPAPGVVPAGAIGVVSSAPITAEEVAAVAAAQGITAQEAARREARDVLFERGALAAGYADAASVQAAVRGRLSRASLMEIFKDAARDDPSDAEVAAATARHFVELDRPESFRVIHAVVRTAADAPAPLRAKARALAERIAEHVAKATTVDEFRHDVDEVTDRGDLEVVVEELKPVAADGRVIDLQHRSGSPETLVLPFVRAASRLTEPGQKSGVVPTEFGFHVLMLLEKLPAHVVPLEDRRNSLRPEIIGDRANRRRSERVAELRSATPPLIERSAKSLIETLDLGLVNDETR